MFGGRKKKIGLGGILFFAGFQVEPWFELGSPIWGALAIAFFLYGWYSEIMAYLRRYRTGYLNEIRIPELAPKPQAPVHDSAIEWAISHVVETAISEPSFESDYYAETRAFRAIFKQALKGKITLFGRLPEEDFVFRVSIEALRDLDPQEMVVPRSNRYPNGRCWGLIPKVFQDGPPREQSIIGIYSDLKVRRNEIFKLWPNTGRAN